MRFLIYYEIPKILEIPGTELIKLSKKSKKKKKKKIK